MSSPGDVPAERIAVIRSLEELNREPGLSDRVLFKPIAWDVPGASPLVATVPPQLAVNRAMPLPSECDLVVVIFGERIGSPPAEPRRLDGRPYLSGTEYEYCDAIRGHGRAGRPEVIVYRRWPLPELAADDPDFPVRSEQRGLLERFFEDFRNPDGSHSRSFNAYASPADFERRIAQDLKKLAWLILEGGS